MLFDFVIILAVAAVGLFVALSLFDRVGKAKKGKKAAVKAVKPQQQQAKKAAPAKASAKKAPAMIAEPEVAAPKHVQTGMTAEKFVVITLDDVKKQNQDKTQGHVDHHRPSEFSKRQRERDESQGFKVIDKEAPVKAPRKVADDEQVVTAKEQFDRKLNAFFRAGDRKRKDVRKPQEGGSPVTPGTTGGRVQMGKAGFSAKTWGEVSAN